MKKKFVYYLFTFQKYLSAMNLMYKKWEKENDNNSFLNFSVHSCNINLSHASSADEKDDDQKRKKQNKKIKTWLTFYDLQQYNTELLYNVKVRKTSEPSSSLVQQRYKSQPFLWL